MIIRVFNATVKPGAHAEYEQLLRERAANLKQAEAGLLHVHIGTPLPETPNEYVVVTLWEDLEALKRFTGDAWNKPVPLANEGHLVETSRVQHYDALPLPPLGRGR